MKISFKCWSTIPPISTTMNNHLSPQLIEHKKNQWHMMLEIQVLAWESH